MSIRERIIDWYRARQRGEVRVAPYGTRGRVFAKKNEPQSNQGPLMEPITSKATAVIHMKVTRANGDVEHITVPATVTKVE